MRSMRVLSLVLFVLAAFVSCSRDPNVAKKHYLDSGNKYFEKGKYKEAAIMYRSALQKDLRYGPAYYKLALAQLKLRQISPAVNALRRSIELNKAKDPASADAHWDSVVKLSELFVASADPRVFNEVEQNIKDLLEHDANSWDGHRLAGDLAFVRGTRALQTSNREEAKKQIDLAVVEYRKANSIKPGQEGVQMQLARGLAYNGDYAGAEQLYRQVLDRNKTFLYGYTDLYKLYMFENKPDAGEQLLKQAAQNNPKEYGFLTLLATHYSMLHRPDDMVNVLRQIKSHAKEYPRAYEVVGSFYLRLGDGDSAIREYNEGIQKDSARKAVYQKRKIEVLMHQGKRSEAAQLNQQILKDNPKDNDAKGLEATFLLDRGELNRALAELQAVVTSAPDNAVARFNLGRAYYAKGQSEEARQMFQKAIELRPDFIQARIALAKLEVTRGEYDLALKAAAQILTIDPNNLNARLIESAALMGQKKFNDSRQMLNAMLLANPNSPDVLFQLGAANLAEKQFKDAEGDFRKSYQLNPSDLRGLMGLVETEMAQKKGDEALELLRTESAKTPGRLELLMQLGNTAVHLGRWDDAINSYQKALDSLDKNATRERGEVLVRMGETYRLKGDAQNAVVYLQKAREALPDNPLVLGALALVLDGAGRWTDAQQVYQATIKMDPNNAVSLNNSAFLMAEHGGDLDSALTMATKARQLLPNMAEISDTVGWIYLKKGMADNAVDAFRELVKKQPHTATYRYHLGMALMQKGDKPAALREFQTALQDNPAKVERDRIEEQIQKIG